MNFKDIKSQFPIFKSNKNLIYFDTANSAQKPIQVIDALEDSEVIVLEKDLERQNQL